MKTRRAFTLIEIVIGMAVLAIVLVIGLALINPSRVLNESKDSIRVVSVERISEGLNLYNVDNRAFPTARGSSLPLVTPENILEQGALVRNLDNFVRIYLNQDPVDPDGNDYYVGLLNSSTPVVATVLSDGSTHLSMPEGISVSETLPSTNLSSITVFDLSESPAGTPIGGLYNGRVINLADYSSISIVAEPAQGAQISAVEFYVNGSFEQRERALPYAIAGDGGGNLNPWAAGTGEYTLTVVPFDGSGSRGVETTINFTLQFTDLGDSPGPDDPFAIGELVVVDTGGNPITLGPGNTVDLNVYPDISVWAVPNVSGNISEVDFGINGSYFRTERVEPYSINGDGGYTSFNAWRPGPGDYIITATPYDASGNAHSATVLNLSLVN